MARRIRPALATARTRSATVARALSGWLATERQEIGILLGAGMLACGSAAIVDVSFHSRTLAIGTGLVVMGAIWIWIHLPAREPFIVRPPAVEKGRREV